MNKGKCATKIITNDYIRENKITPKIADAGMCICTSLGVPYFQMGK